MVDAIVKVAPIVRGLLAQATGDEDMPFRPVILGWEKGIDSNALQIEGLDVEGDFQKIKKPLQKAIDAYQADKGEKPAAVCVEGIGTFVVKRKADQGDLPLQNKVAVVTGAAGAIGYGVCQGLLANGCFLAASDLAGGRLDDFAGELKQVDAERVIGVEMDVRSEDSVSDGFGEVVRTWGGIDIVVINAGIAYVSELKEMELAEFRRLEQVNVEGTMLTLKESANHFIRGGTGGDIVIMSTKNVPCPGASFGAYSATKAAAHQLGRIGSMELAQYGVRVNMVAPDAVFAEGRYKSGLWQEVGPGRMKARGLDEKGLQEYYRDRNLLKVQVTGKHVANAVLFFVRRETPTTGATIPVDGGLPDATPR